MEKVVVRNYRAVSVKVAELVEKRIGENPRLALGLATGSTPVGLYERLVISYQEGELDLSGVTTFNLDEYCGLAGDHPQSFRFYMDDHLFKLVNIDRSRVHFPSGEDGEGEYERKIREAGGIDLQILGIGRNGHIGFNEPGSPFDSRTRVVDLADATREDNTRFFMSPEDVPRQAATMGLATIMEAAEIILLASGANKANAIRRMCLGEPSVETPASVLQKHERVTVIVDKEANN